MRSFLDFSGAFSQHNLGALQEKEEEKWSCDVSIHVYLCVYMCMCASAFACMPVCLVGAVPRGLTP